MYFLCPANCTYRRHGDVLNLNAIGHVFPPPCTKIVVKCLSAYLRE